MGPLSSGSRSKSSSLELSSIAASGSGSAAAGAAAAGAAAVAAAAAGAAAGAFDALAVDAVAEAAARRLASSYSGSPSFCLTFILMKSLRFPMLPRPTCCKRSRASSVLMRRNRPIDSSSRGRVLISASRRSEGSMSGKPSALRDHSVAFLRSSMRLRLSSSSCQRFSSRSRFLRSSACLASSSFHDCASAALTTTMFSPLMDFTSSLPRSNLSSTSQREASVAFCLCTMPHLPLRCGAFWRPAMRTAWPALRSTTDFFFPGPSSVKSSSTAFFAPSAWYHRPVFWSCMTPTLLATNMWTFTDSSLKSRRWPWERSLWAFFQCPSFLWATPRTW
mmetsp:Transcript_82267/g.254334  ORF Transcript_82267/g.254334 Transcript_82267/m.254334 type:complete len:334 (+) Transcript_82267:542-1543(+)